MIKYPLPTPNPDNIIQNEMSKDDQQRLAISYLASEAALFSTYEAYLDAINSNSLKSVPSPNAENLAILLEAKYSTVKDFWEAVAADEEGDLIAPPELFMLIPPHERSDIDTMRVELVHTNGPPGMTIKGPDDMLTYAKSMSDYDREHMIKTITPELVLHYMYILNKENNCEYFKCKWWKLRIKHYLRKEEK